MARENTPEAVGKGISDWVADQFVATTRASVNPGSVAAEASGDTTVTVTGALLGDFVDASWETDVITGVNVAVYIFVSAADTVTVHISNNNVAAGAAIDIAATQMQFVVHRRMRSV